MEVGNGQKYSHMFDHPGVVWDGVKDGKSEQQAIDEIFPTAKTQHGTWRVPRTLKFKVDLSDCYEVIFIKVER